MPKRRKRRPSVTERALLALAPVLAEQVDAVCVTRGGVIGGLLARWFPCRSGRYGWTPAPGTGFQIDFSGGLPRSVCPLPVLHEATHDG